MLQDTGGGASVRYGSECAMCMLGARSVGLRGGKGTAVGGWGMGGGGLGGFGWLLKC